MNLRVYLFLIGVAFLLFNAGCQQNPTEPTATKTTTVSGFVYDSLNNGLYLARVIDIGSLAPVDTSKLNGSYKLTMELSDKYTTSIYAILSGYSSDTQTVSLTPGDNLTAKNLHMKVVDASKIVAGTSGSAARIVTQSNS